MEQSGTDRRVRKTKSQLRLALMELLVEKSAKNISVRELAERHLLHPLSGRWRPFAAPGG